MIGLEQSLISISVLPKASVHFTFRETRVSSTVILCLLQKLGGYIHVHLP